jgi:hypothetical protein
VADRQYRVKIVDSGAAAEARNVRALAAAYRDLQQAQAGGTEATAKTTSSLQQLGSAVAAIGLASAALSEVREGIAAIGASAQAVRDLLIDTAKENLAFREMLREYKFIKGESGGNDHTPEDVLKFAAETGLTKEESGKFLKAQQDALNTLPTARRPSQEVNEAVAREAGRLTARADMDPVEAGKIAGILGQYGEIKTAEQGVEQVGKIAEQLGKNSTFDFKKMMPAFFGIMSEMSGDGGRVAKPEDLAAVFSAGTTQFGNAARTATGVRQANRLLRRLDGKSGELLKEFGVTEEDDFVEALRKVAPHVTGGQGDRFMKKHGFNNMTEIASVVKFAQVMPKIEEALGDNARPGFGKKLVDANRRDFEEDPALLKRRADTEMDITRHVFGKPGELLSIAREQAEARLVARNQINAAKGKDGKAAPTMGEFFRNQLTLPWEKDARSADIDDEVKARLDAALEAHGVTEAERAKLPHWDTLRATGKDDNEAFGARVGLLQERAGPKAVADVFSSKEAIDRLDKLISLAEQRQKERQAMDAPRRGGGAWELWPHNPPAPVEPMR